MQEINHLLRKLGKPVLTSPLIRKLQRAKKRAHQRKNPAWKSLSRIVSHHQSLLLQKQTDDKINNAVRGSKSWWTNIKDLCGETQNKAQNAPLICMDNEWLTIPQFVEQLNTYYL